MSQVPSSTSGSTILGNCVSCQGLVRVPIQTPADSSVRCPHCQQTYRLAEVLAQLVPELEVMTPQRTTKANESIPRVDQVLHKPEVVGSGEKFVVPIQLSEGAKRRRSKRRRSSSDEDGLDSGRDDYHLAPLIETDRDQRPRQRSSDSSSARRSRGSSQRGLAANEKSTVMEAIKVMMGAAMAIPIAYLLVLGLFKQDPLHLGPIIGDKLPFLVPKEFRESPVADPENSNSLIP